ncbi:MAG: ribosomal protein [Bacillota bacterium]
MLKGILGKKIGMTQIFGENGEALPVTVVEAGPCSVLQRKLKEKDGYAAVQLGFDIQKEKRVTKALLGHVKKSDAKPCKFMRELRDFLPEQAVTVEIFNVGDVVDVTGVSRGKGFAGSIKRHNHSRGPMSHGSHYHRGPGSLGSIAANRVFPGHKLPGRMGGEQVTVKNLKVVQINKERNLLYVQGSIPGPRKGYLVVKAAKG